MSYKIITDTCCDFPAQMYQQLDLGLVNLSVRFQGEEKQSYDELMTACAPEKLPPPPLSTPMAGHR